MGPFNILSYNVASSSNLAGLTQLLNIFKPKVVFLQEVCLDTQSLLSIIGNVYTGQSNLDPNDINKPGTAILWSNEFKGYVFNLVPCRIQGFKIEGLHFLNI